MFDSILDNNERHGTPSSSKKLQEAVSRVTEEEEKYSECDVNNVTMDTLFQPLVTINTQREDANVTNARRIASDIHAEMMKEFKVFTIQSTISDSAHSEYNKLDDAISDSEELADAVRDSEELVDAVRNSKEVVNPINNLASNPMVATHTSDGNYSNKTTNRNSPHKFLEMRVFLSIIQGVISLLHQANADGILTCGGALDAVRTGLSEEIITGVVLSTARVFKDPPVVNWKVASRLIPIDMNIVGVSPRATTQVLTDTGTSGTSAPPICLRRQ